MKGILEHSIKTNCRSITTIRTSIKESYPFLLTKRNGDVTMVHSHGENMYNEIVFALLCFAVGFICGVGAFVTVLLLGMKSLSKRMKPKH